MGWSTRSLFLLPILAALAGCGEGGGSGTGGSQSLSLSVAPGDGKNTLTFSAQSGSAITSFNVYFSTSPSVTTSTGTKIQDAQNPFTHSSLTNGTVLFYIVTPVSGGIEGAPSAEVGAMPGKWTALNPSGGPPPRRDSHTAVYNSASDRMIVFGGKSPTLNDLWILTGANGPSPSWTFPAPSAGPQARAGHTAVYNQQANKMVVFGGSFDPEGNSLTDELWALSNADAEGASPQWAALAGSGPPARWGHAAVYDSEGDRMVVFGGTSRTGTGGGLQNDVWVLNGAATANPAWQKIEPTGSPPLRRCCTAFSYDPAGRRLVIFGGFGGFTQSGPILFDDLWTLSFDSTFQNGAWKSLDPSGGGAPTARCCAVSLWTGDKLLLFGGGSFQAASDDKIHALILQSSTFVSADGPSGGPSPRNFPTAVSAGLFLLFGGSDSSGPLNDLWRLE